VDDSFQLKLRLEVEHSFIALLELKAGKGLIESCSSIALISYDFFVHFFIAVFFE
jgi:hypothetical protein